MLLLPSSFDNIVTTLLFGKETLKFDEVVVVLLINKTRRGNNGFSNDGQVAVVTKEYSRGMRTVKREGRRVPTFKIKWSEVQVLLLQ